MAECYSSVIVLLLNNTTEPKGWGRLHVGAERGPHCEHFQVLMTNLLEKHWKWQENRKEAELHGTHRDKTLYLASLDVKTAFGVATAGVIAGD